MGINENTTVPNMEENALPFLRQSIEKIVQESTPIKLTTTAPTTGNVKTGEIVVMDDGTTESVAVKTGKGNLITLTADLLPSGAVQGDVIYHSGSAWVVLNPGTAGYLLKTQGAAANPVWVAPATTAIKTGSYTGDGGNTKAITGVGFQPTHIKLHREDDTFVMEKFAGDGTWATYANNYVEDVIISFDADGFTVGDSGENPNENLIVVNYIAWKD